MTTLVKECPVCKFKNPDTDNWCQECRTSLAGVQPTDPNKPPPPPRSSTLRLELAADPARAFVVLPGQTVGAPGHRERPDVAVDDVPDEGYISGRHVQVLRHGQDWFVQHVGRTNYIVVDGTRYADAGEEIPIHDGSSLFLSYTEFIVRIEVPS